jgi:hypothetical protein
VGANARGYRKKVELDTDALTTWFGAIFGAPLRPEPALRLVGELFVDASGQRLPLERDRWRSKVFAIASPTA